MNPADFIAEFREEAAEKLDLIATQLLRFERDSSSLHAVREMFLAAHTIKGGASMLRLANIQELAHALEDMLASLRDYGRTLDTSSADLLFQTIDRLRALVMSASAADMGTEADPAQLEFAERLRVASRTAEPVPAPAAAPPAPASTADGQRRALVVDDSATVRELHAHLLSQLGYLVDCVAEGDQALSRALRVPYRLVVAGLELAGLSGFDLTRSLRATDAYTDVPIVLVSADADGERCQRAVDAGAQALLRKASLAEQRLTQTLVELGAAAE
jgi:CheY-like chemotaxis protein